MTKGSDPSRTVGGLNSARIFNSPGFARLRRLLPVQLRDLVVGRMMFADRESRRAFARAYKGEGETAPIRVRVLDGNPIWVRPGRSDAIVLRESLTYRDALPPQRLAPERIFDIGANIGATMALLAATFRDAQVVGFEPHPEAAAIARKNAEPWSERCELVEAAVYTHDGTIMLSGDWDAALTVGGDDGIAVQAISFATAVDRYGVPDYVKLDIEGAEAALLAEPRGWDQVGCVSVEVHNPYTVERCTQDLRALGFEVSLQAGPREPRVIGRRPR